MNKHSRKRSGNTNLVISSKSLLPCSPVSVERFPVCVVWEFVDGSGMVIYTTVVRPVAHARILDHGDFFVCSPFCGLVLELSMVLAFWDIFLTVFNNIACPG